MSYGYEERLKHRSNFEVSECGININTEYLDLNETVGCYVNYDDANRKARSVLNKKKYAGFESREFYDKTPLSEREAKMRNHMVRVNFVENDLKNARKDAQIPAETEYMRSRPLFVDIASRESTSEYFGYGRELLGDEKWKELNEIENKKLKEMREKINANMLAGKTTKNLCASNYREFSKYENDIEMAKKMAQCLTSQVSKKIFKEEDKKASDDVELNFDNKSEDNIAKPVSAVNVSWFNYSSSFKNKKESQNNESVVKEETKNIKEQLEELIDETGKIKSDLNNINGNLTDVCDGLNKNILQEINEIRKELNKYVKPKLEKPEPEIEKSEPELEIEKPELEIEKPELEIEKSEPELEIEKPEPEPKIEKPELEIEKSEPEIEKSEPEPEKQEPELELESWEVL